MVALQRRLRTALFSSGHDVKLKVILKRPLEGPPLPLTLSGSDMIFVLKVKIELALRLLRETAQEGSTAPLPQAEDIELEFRGVPLRDMMAIDRYGIESGAELVAATLRDVTPETLRRVAAEVKARGPFGFDLRKAFWPYWLHALTRHRWRRSRAAALAFSL